MPVRIQHGIEIWTHSGKAGEPYARLSDGEEPVMTSSFANCTPLVMNPKKLEQALHELVGKYRMPSRNHVVVAQSRRSKTIGSHLAKILEAEFWWTVNANNSCVVIDNSIRTDTSREAIIALDVVCSGVKLRQIKEALARIGVPIAPFMYCLSNRSGEHEVEGMEIRALTTEKMQSWKFGDNPFTENGMEEVEPLNPRTEWIALTRGGRLAA